MVKASRFELRAEPEQLERWRQAATADGRSLGDWITRVADVAAQEALAILPPPVPGKVLQLKRTEKKTIEEYRLALLYAIDALGPSPESEGMEEIVKRLEHPPRSGSTAYLFNHADQALIRQAQLLVSKRKP